MLTFIGLLAFLALSISLELEEGMKDILTYLKDDNSLWYLTSITTVYAITNKRKYQK